MAKTTTCRRRKPRLQQTWFEFERRPATPPANRTRTSIAAAEAIADLGPTLRAKVFNFVGAQADGATREEIAAALSMPLQTVCGRVAELLELRLLYRTDETRPTASGRAAAVVRATGGERRQPVRRCRACGCTDDQACVVGGVPCSWVEADLCSACASEGGAV